MAKVGRKPYTPQERKSYEIVGRFNKVQFEEIREAAGKILPGVENWKAPFAERAILRHARDAGRSHNKKED